MAAKRKQDNRMPLGIIEKTLEELDYGSDIPRLAACRWIDDMNKAEKVTGDRNCIAYCVFDHYCVESLNGNGGRSSFVNGVRRTVKRIRRKVKSAAIEAESLDIECR